jgi:hypothetical protein
VHSNSNLSIWTIIFNVGNVAKCQPSVDDGRAVGEVEGEAWKMCALCVTVVDIVLFCIILFAFP